MTVIARILIFIGLIWGGLLLILYLAVQALFSRWFSIDEPQDEEDRDDE